MTDKIREEIKGKVISLRDLIQYQDGTVASRMIINRKAGSITLFSFDRGEGISEHTAPFDAVITILEGESEVLVGSEIHRMKEGDSLILPANILHALMAPARFKMMLVMIQE